ncbi:sigma-70 family RNA polymerase sigma factor [candidate division KSB1 bacterium]|nr:sigma-70 family RNA polymerase sigma factor [candidate division KSB1 bacterium]
MQIKSDTELSQLIKNSDHTAFRELYERYWQPLYHFLWSRTLSESLATEFVQEVFVRLWNFREQLNTQKNIKSYLYRIANNLIIDSHRKQKIRIQHQQEEQQSAQELDPINIELQTQLEIAIEKLPEKLRTVFVLHHLRQYTYIEIADMCNVSKKTVEKRMKKAIYILQKYFI